MQTYDVVTKVLTVREYDPNRRASTDAIRRILNAAVMTASAMNRQPWLFVVVREKAKLKQIADLSPTGRHIAGADFAVAIAIDQKNKWGQIDGARAIQSMTIQAWDEGLGSGWVGNIDRDKVKDLLNIPKEYDLLTVIPFGYPTRRYAGKKNRKPFQDVVFLEKFPQKF